MPAAGWEVGLLRSQLDAGHLDDDLKSRRLEPVAKTLARGVVDRGAIVGLGENGVANLLPLKSLDVLEFRSLAFVPPVVFIILPLRFDVIKLELRRLINTAFGQDLEINRLPEPLGLVIAMTVMLVVVDGGRPRHDTHFASSGRLKRDESSPALPHCPRT